jgi:hypothetical protein
MKRRLTNYLTVAAAPLVLAACGGAAGSISADPQSGTNCPPPTFFPAQLWLSYPMPSTMNVPVSVGQIILANTGGSGPFSITVTSGAASVPVGAVSRAPSPLPTPYATPGPNTQSNMTVYLAAPIPTLSPATTYTVTASIENGVNTPQCADITPQTLGAFTTM